MARDRVPWVRALFLPEARPAAAATPWKPPVDVYRSRDGWVAKFDLAGVRPEDVTLTVEGRRLTLRGTRHDCTLDEGCSHYVLEISYSRFERTIELPESLERAAVTTEFRAGMLLVRFQREAP